MSRCPNCMNELVQDRCTRCGYPAVEVTAVRNALPPETVLLERYELGYALASNQQAIAYIAFDCVRRQPVVVMEFFPKVNAVRKKNAVSAKKHPDLFMDACRRFLTSEQAMPMRLLHTFADNNTAYRVYQLAGNAANAVQEADELMDNPILFRDGDGKPVMAVNALPIPPLPHTTEWKLSRRLSSERTRKKVNRFAIGALALIAAAVVGVVVVSMNRTYDVTVRVNTEDALTGAKLGDVELPAATPNAEGYVEYNASLKRGEYAFSATSEHEMSNEPAVLKAGEENALTVHVPTPSPVPVVINANAGEWAYCLPGDTPMMVTGSIAAPIVNPLEAGQLVRFGVSTEQGRAPEGVELRLMRDGYKLPLDLSSGAASIDLTRGSYRLLVIDKTSGLELNSLPVELSADAEKQLDVEPYEYYTAHLANADPSSFYYISDAETPLKVEDVLRLNEWADDEEVGHLFGSYEQHEVTFRIAEGIPADAVVTINGHVWTKEATFTGEATPVEVRITTKDGSLILEESFSVEAVTKPEYVLGQSEADAYAARWEGVTGLMRVAGKGYKQMKDESDPLKLATVVVPVTDDDWNRMIADTQMYPDKKQYAPKVVTLKVPDYKIKAGAVEWVTIDGVQLEADPDSQGMVYTVEISTGTWWMDGSLKGDPDHNRQALYVLDSFDEYDIDVFNPGYTDVLTYSFYSIPGFVQRLDGTVDYMLSDEDAKELIPAEKWLGYATCYNIDGVLNGDWTMHPVSITIDPRVRVEPEKLFARLDGHPIDLIEVDGVWTVNASAVTGTNHNVWVYVTYENGERESLAWPVMYGTEMLLLKGQADVWEADLKYAAINGEVIQLAGSEALLTDATVTTARNAQTMNTVATTLTIANPDDWKLLTFAVRPAGTAVNLVTIGSMTDGSVNFSATAGEYELWVLADEDGTYEKEHVTTITVGSGEVIALDQKLGENYRIAQNQNVQIRIDSRIWMGDESPLYVRVDFVDTNLGDYLGEVNTDGNGGYVQMKDGRKLQNGEYAVKVEVQNPNEASLRSPQYFEYTVTLADGHATYTDANGNPVTALLSDVADAAQASACWWGLTPDTLELLPGSENTWMLTEVALEGTRENAKLVYLKYPLGTEQVPAYENMNWKFGLEIVIGDQTLKLPFTEQRYFAKKPDDRYQEMYLSEGAEYRLIVVVPVDNQMKEFDLGGIVITAADVETRPGVNDKLMLTKSKETKDEAPVVELVLGYYDKDHADFGGENAAPASKPAVTPTPVVTTPPAETTPPAVTPTETTTPSKVPSQSPEECKKLGHEGVWVTTEEATCKITGIWHWECKEPGCNVKGPDRTKKVDPHVYTAKVTKEASCTEEGETTYTCSNCGDLYTEPIAKKEHSYGDPVTTEATCTTDGKTVATCSCGATQETTIPATGHNYQYTVTQEPTCKNVGWKMSLCTKCKAENPNAAPLELQKTTCKKEDLKFVKTVPPTCMVNGFTEYRCEECGVSQQPNEYIVPALGHEVVNGECVRPGCKYKEVPKH